MPCASIPETGLIRTIFDCILHDLFYGLFFLYFFNNYRIIHFLMADSMKVLVSIFFLLLSVQQSANSKVVSPNSVHKTMVPYIGIRINGGARYTNSTEVEVEIKSLKTADELIEQMASAADTLKLRAPKPRASAKTPEASSETSPQPPAGPDG